MGQCTARLLDHTTGRRVLKVSRPADAAGITLIESLIVLVISAVVLAAGVPAFGRWMRDLEIQRNASSLVAALQSARAEAIARNAEIQVSLGDSAGNAIWRWSCVQVSPQCPATLLRQSLTPPGDVRWGAAPRTAMPAFNNVLVAGTGLPALIRFNSLGAVASNLPNAAIARLDITHIDDVQARRLVVLVAAQGMVRVCDPAAGNGRAEACP